MSIEHGEIFAATIATATLTALTAVETNGGVVKVLPDPKLLRASVKSADAQYGTLHNPESFPSAPDPALYLIPGTLIGADQGKGAEQFNPGMAVIPRSTFTIKGYQDSGGNAAVYGLIVCSYGKGESIPQGEVHGILRSTRVAKGANLTASAWTTVNTFTGVAGKRYAILGALAHSANAKYVRFRHSNFEGLYPTLDATTDVDKRMAWFQNCPIFSGDEDLTIEGFTTGAEDMTVIVVMKEL